MCAALVKQCDVCAYVQLCALVRVCVCGGVCAWQEAGSNLGSGGTAVINKADFLYSQSTRECNQQTKGNAFQPPVGEGKCGL